MVFTTLARWLPRSCGTGIINRGTDKFWRIQQTLRFTWKFRGRARNCFTIGVRYANKALMYATKARKLKKKDMRDLWNVRVEAAAQEHGLGQDLFLEGLAQSGIQLDRKVLTDLAIYEPRTFQSLCEVSKAKVHQEGLAKATTPKPTCVITRGML